MLNVYKCFWCSTTLNKFLIGFMSKTRHYYEQNIKIYFFFVKIFVAIVFVNISRRGPYYEIPVMFGMIAVILWAVFENIIGHLNGNLVCCKVQKFI